jgi:hypothetical protein
MNPGKAAIWQWGKTESRKQKAEIGEAKAIPK